MSSEYSNKVAFAESQTRGRKIALAIGDHLWHKSAVPTFIERFVLTIFAAVVVALIANPMGFDTTQRITGALTLIFAAYFLAHTLHKLPPEVPPLPPRAQEETLPTNRPQILITRWGQIEPDKAARAAHVIQEGFYIKNIGLGETAIGITVELTVPAEIPDVWSSGGGSGPTIAIGKDEVVFVPVWRKLAGSMFTRWDLHGFLHETYEAKLPGNKRIPISMRYGSNGKKYITTQDLIYSPELNQIVGFGDPEQQFEQSAPKGASPSTSSLTPNLVLKNIHTGGLIFTGDEWRQFELPGRHLSNRLSAVWAELKNDSSESRRVGPISGIKAELVVIRESGGEKFSPLVWLDNEFNAVNFELADTRHVLLVANMNDFLSPMSSWVIPLNHRTRNDSASGSLCMDVSHWMEEEDAEIRLNLLHVTTGAVIQSFAGKYIWREGRSGPSITLKSV
jgi:hypothetical protein